MSRSPSRSEVSHASTDSMDLPPPAPTSTTEEEAHPHHHSDHHRHTHEQSDTANNGVESTSAAPLSAHHSSREEGEFSSSAPPRPHSGDEEQGGEAPAGQTSLFIGLGPAARHIRSEELTQFLKEKASDPSQVGEVRLRGRCAFVDIASSEEADRLIASLDGEMFQNRCRMAVQRSRQPRRADSESRRARRVPGGAGANVSSSSRSSAHSSSSHSRGGGGRSGGMPSLFVGLGPAGASIPDQEIRAKLEEAVPLTAFRRHGQCAFIEVASPEDAERMISNMNNQYIGEARLSVQYSRDGNSSRRDRMNVIPRSHSYNNNNLSHDNNNNYNDRRGDVSRDRRDDRRRMRSRSPVSRRDPREERRHRRHRSDSKDRRRRRRSYSNSSRDSRSRSLTPHSRGRRSYSNSSRGSSVSRDRHSRPHRSSRRN